MRASRSAIGVSEPVPASSCQRRREVVDHRHLVAASRETERGGPAEVAVAAKYQYSHRRGSVADGGGGADDERGVLRHSIRPMANGLAARNGGRAGLAALVAILLLGVGLRAQEAWDGRAPVYDASAYARIAANLDAGRGFTAGAGATQPSSNYSPGLPLLTAGVYELTGGVHDVTARLLLALLGSLAVPFTYLLARRLRRAMHWTHPDVLDASSGAMELDGGGLPRLPPA